MSVQVDPYQLQFLGSRFSAGSQEIRLRAKRLEGIMNELVQGTWKGEGAHAFAIKCEMLIGGMQDAADVLTKAVTTLNRFAMQMERVNHLRQQAYMLEQQSWQSGGDSIDDLHHRQNLVRQAAQLRLEAEWEANAADSQAANEFNAIMAMIPKIMEQANSWTIAQMKQNDEVSMKDYINDREQLMEALKAYYISKKPDNLSDQDKEEAAEDDLKYFSGLANDQLYDRLQELMEDDELADYYAKKVQQPDFDAKQQWNTDLGYQKFVKVEGAQNEGPGGLMAAGMLFAAGIMKMLGPKYRPDTGKPSGDDEKDDSLINDSETSEKDNTLSTSNMSSTEDASQKESVDYGDHYTKVNGKKVLKENVEYTDSNGYKYNTDGQGRITDVNANLKAGPGNRNKYAQLQAGQPDRAPTDQGGHLIATIFNGSGDIDNLVAMDSNLNQGQYKKLETVWKNALDDGQEVKVSISVNYENDSMRPSSFEITYSIDDMERTIEFKNSPGGN